MTVAYYYIVYHINRKKNHYCNGQWKAQILYLIYLWNTPAINKHHSPLPLDCKTAQKIALDYGECYMILFLFGASAILYKHGPRITQHRSVYRWFHVVCLFS